MVGGEGHRSRGLCVTMLIVCPSCATAFRVTRTVLGDAGRQVRCAQCRTVWLATPESAIEDDAMATTGAGASPARAAPPPPPPPPQPEDDADWGAAFAEEAETRSAPKGGEGTAAKGNDIDFDAPVPAAEAPSIQPSADVPPLPSRIVDADDAPPLRPARPKATTAEAALPQACPAADPVLPLLALGHSPDARLGAARDLPARPRAGGAHGAGFRQRL